MFGYPIEVPRQRYWGARAIFQNGSFSMLPDRQGLDAPQGPETTAFVTWLNCHALPWLRSEIARVGLTSSMNQELVLKQFKYELRANPNASYGYLYIGAVEHTLVECEPQINPATQKPEKVVKIGEEKFIVDDGIVPVGTEGYVKVNNIGPARVVGYYEEKYSGNKLACLMVEVFSPPKWWIDQTQSRELIEAVKAGTVPRKRGSLPQYNEPSPKAAKEFKANWKPKPFPLWPNDFVANKSEAAA
jgi:hypothetical protein